MAEALETKCLDLSAQRIAVFNVRRPVFEYSLQFLNLLVPRGSGDVVAGFFKVSVTIRIFGQTQQFGVWRDPKDKPTLCQSSECRCHHTKAADPRFTDCFVEIGTDIGQSHQHIGADGAPEHRDVAQQQLVQVMVQFRLSDLRQLTVDRRYRCHDCFLALDHA